MKINKIVLAGLCILGIASLLVLTLKNDLNVFKKENSISKELEKRGLLKKEQSLFAGLSVIGGGPGKA